MYPISGKRLRKNMQLRKSRRDAPDGTTHAIGFGKFRHMSALNWDILEAFYVGRMGSLNFGRVFLNKGTRSFHNIRMISNHSLDSGRSEDINVEFLDGDRTGMTFSSS